MVHVSQSNTLNPAPHSSRCPHQAMGAEVLRLRPVSITHPDHFVNVARRRAAEQPNAIFADQFENPANFRAHLKTGAWRAGMHPRMEACRTAGQRASW